MAVCTISAAEQGADGVFGALRASQAPAFPEQLNQPASSRREAFCAAALSVWQRSPTTPALLRSGYACAVGSRATPGLRSNASSAAAIITVVPDVTARLDVRPRLGHRHHFWPGGFVRRTFWRRVLVRARPPPPLGLH